MVNSKLYRVLNSKIAQSKAKAWQGGMLNSVTNLVCLRALKTFEKGCVIPLFGPPCFPKKQDHLLYHVMIHGILLYSPLLQQMKNE